VMVPATAVEAGFGWPADNPVAPSATTLATKRSATTEIVRPDVIVATNSGSATTGR
jgi:hypothetical protein